jgi:hypothetical protein
MGQQTGQQLLLSFGTCGTRIGPIFSWKLAGQGALFATIFVFAGILKTGENVMKHWLHS